MPTKPIPKWLYEVKADGALNVRDFAAVLGISKSELNKRIKRGTAPAPLIP